MDMLHGERRTQEGQEEVHEGQTKEDVAITPLAIPMLAGPGAISTVIVLSSEARTVAELAIVYGSVVVTGIVCYLVLRLGEGVLIRLGRTGIRVLTRIMGLILAAVAVQFVMSGIKEAFDLP
jgi:multiple antibiotic resistance protein